MFYGSVLLQYQRTQTGWATSVETEAGLKGREVVDVDEGIHGQQQVESVVEIEAAEGSDLRLSGRDVESINEKPLRND